MEKLMQFLTKQQNAKGMTLIEVLVALAVVSFVFSSLLQMTFDSLKRVKILELQDKMRNYATELVQVVYNAKDTDWPNTFGDGTDVSMPPSTSSVISQQPQGYIYIDPSNPTAKPTIKELSYGDCHFNPGTNLLEGGDCDKTAAKEVLSPTSTTTKVFFGRIIVRTDNDILEGTEKQDSQNDANVEIIVACIEGRCDPATFRPFKLNFQIYRTSGP